MKKYIAVLAMVILFASCGRVGETQSDTGAPNVSTTGSGDIIFDVRSKSQLVDINGNSYVDKGHYSMLVQTKDKNNNPLGNLTDLTYELFENNAKSASDEAKVIMSQDARATTNRILLLLDFSGSLISDCDNVSIISDNVDNLCYQLVESAKQFVDDVVNDQQTMAIYYFNSKTNITPLVTSSTASSTDDKAALKEGLNQLYDSTFRADELQGYDSTNLNGAVIEATKEACKWVDQCNYDVYKPQTDTNLESFEFASIVVFTDGKDLANRVSETEMLSFIDRHEDLYYYTIGLGDVDKETLESIGRDKYIPVSQNSDLEGAFDDLSSQLASWGNSFYKVNYCPASQEGSVDVKIKVGNDDYSGIISDTIKLPENIDFRCDL